MVDGEFVLDFTAFVLFGTCFYFMSCLSKSKFCQHYDNPQFPVVAIVSGSWSQISGKHCCRNAFWYWQNKHKEFGVYLIGHLNQRSNFSYLYFISLSKYHLEKKTYFLFSKLWYDRHMYHSTIYDIFTLTSWTNWFRVTILCRLCVWESKCTSGCWSFKSLAFYWQTVNFSAHLCKIKITSDLEVKLD